MRTLAAAAEPVSIVIPTYRREDLLVETIGLLVKLDPPAAEIIVVDQTSSHSESVEQALENLDASGAIRWVRLPRPSITHAMNVGLVRSRHDIVLFLDDDVIPDDGLVSAHRKAHDQSGCAIVAGRVVQPWDEPGERLGRRPPSPFSAASAGPTTDFVGCNFSVKRSVALRAGGFDENFVGAAYRYESEFAFRIRASGERIFFAPEAGLRHLKAAQGGIRAYGDFRATLSPVHCVGAYYFALRSGARGRASAVVRRLIGSVRTRHHLRRPWWIPVTLAAELLGLLWAIFLARRGPVLLPGGAP